MHFYVATYWKYARVSTTETILHVNASESSKSGRERGNAAAMSKPSKHNSMNATILLLRDLQLLLRVAIGQQQFVLGHDQRLEIPCSDQTNSKCPCQAL